MNPDALLRHRLGTDDPIERGQAAIDEAAGRRFALRALPGMPGRAPDPDLAFGGRGERSAAHALARLPAKVDDAA